MLFRSQHQRERALALSRALEARRAAAAAGADAAAVRRAAAGLLAAAPGVEVNYAAVVDPLTFVERAGAGLGLPGADGIAADGEVLLAVAARVGRTRLIDNALIDLG